MKEILNSIGWDELYPETLKRMTWFRDAFREFYSVEQISDEELDKVVALTFGIYGQGMVYEIYMKAKNKLNKEETLKNIFYQFVDAFNSPDFKILQPKNYINLFIEYTYSLVIKKQ